jgi:hypothetical protein
MLPVTFSVVLPVAPVRVSVAAKTLVVVTAFAAYRLFERDRVDRFETCQTFRVPTFAVVENKLVVVTAFAAYRLFPSERLDRFETCQTFRVPTFAVVAERFPESVILDATLRTCVLMYGIVNVSNKNVAFAAFAVIEPFTLNVSLTVTFVKFEVPYTFKVLVPYTTAEFTVK